MKNCNKKFVVGFPVDAGEKADPFYYLVLRDKNKFNQGIKSSSGFRKLESINDSQMDHILKKLNEERKYLVFVSSSEKQGDLIPDALPDGNSSTLACLLAGYKEDISYENYSEKSKNPVIMVSCSIYGKPELLKEAQLSRVTSSDSDFSKNSLKRKWNVIKNIQKKGTPVAFILHNDDFTLIKEVLSSDEYEEKSIDEITELFDGGQKNPFLVSLETDDYKKLSIKLECNHTPNLGDKMDEKIRINLIKEEIKKIVENEILKLEKELLDKNSFERFIKESVIKTIKEAAVTRGNILFKSKRKAFKKSIEKNIVPKMKEYLEKRLNQYSENIQKEVKNIRLENIDLNKMGVGDNVSSEASSSVAASIGTAIVSAVSIAISSAFLTTTTWLIFTSSNPIGWAAMIASAVIFVASAGKIGLSSLENKIIKIIGPSENFFRNGILYKLWHEGFKNKETKIEALKNERAKDYERIISELEKNGFKDLL